MASTKEMKLQANEAYVESQKGFKKVDEVKSWWKKHYLQIGHKRLGRMLVGTYDPSQEKDE
jgi:hypothetical protein